MKAAKLAVAAYYVACPYCEELLESRSNGSQIICQDSGYRAGETVECPACGRKFRLPMALARVSA